MNYALNVLWDTSAVDIWFLDTTGNMPDALKGLAYEGKYLVTGVPAATVGHWAPGAKVYNLVDATWYINAGSTASPNWQTIPTSGSAFSLPSVENDTTTTTGISVNWGFNSITSGIAESLSATALTTGKIIRAIATAVTLTTGRYFEAFDGALAVWGIGANGHIHTLQTTAPTVGTVTAQGITAAAVTAGSGDVAGEITTTGTQNNVSATVIPIVFNKTYTAAPKSVQLTALNASGANGTSLPFISAINATGFSISVTPSATAGATPSWSYQVIA